VGSVAVLLWFFAFEARRRYLRLPVTGAPVSDLYYLMQIALALLTLLAVVALAAAIPQSLLSTPDMQVTGNGSRAAYFQWYQDRSDAVLPQASVFSVPLWLYRVAMLAWSLWLVFALLRLAKWGWALFASGGVWPQRPRPSPPPSGPTPQTSQRARLPPERYGRPNDESADDRPPEPGPAHHAGHFPGAVRHCRVHVVAGHRPRQTAVGAAAGDGNHRRPHRLHGGGFRRDSADHRCDRVLHRGRDGLHAAARNLAPPDPLRRHDAGAAGGLSPGAGHSRRTAVFALVGERQPPAAVFLRHRQGL